MAIQIGVPRESRDGEQRVAMVPDVASRLSKLGVQVTLEQGAGLACGYADADYGTATVVPDAATLLASSDIVLTVNPLTAAQIPALKPGAVVVGYQNPYAEFERFQALAERRVSAFSMELIPRISRAQAMDALSSQAAVAGYKAVLMAASLLGKFFPMLTTAAGTIRPSKVLIIGAGVAGLQAIATARRLGAIVEGYDVRAATKEQVESLGAKFVDVGVKAEGSGGYARELTDEEKQQQQAVLARHVAAADVVITTAAIPGRPSPRIITAAMVEAMKGGSVIVDLAAEGGGNCALTQAGVTVEHQRVKIFGPLNVPSTVPLHASELYAKNLLNFLELVLVDGALRIDLSDEIIQGSLVTHDGAIHNSKIRDALAN